MTTASSQFEHELKKLIDAEIDTIKENMVAGSFPDISAYQRHVGIVYAYRRVTDHLFSEANTIINER
jgi:hypothetical protein